MRELGGSALFGARFRENAARSLLIPRAYPGKRTPLWQQRLRAQSLLEVAKDFPRFPVVLETYRECLRDVLDLPALVELLRDLHSRRISLVEVETQTASPFASSLLFDYVATYMYEGDMPNAERRAAALALDRDLLASCSAPDELRELIDPEALDEVERSLQLMHPTLWQGPRRAQQVLRRLGRPERRAEGEARAAEGYSAASMLAKLARERRAVEVRDRRRGALDRERGRRALSRRARRPPPGGLPDCFSSGRRRRWSLSSAVCPHPRPVPDRAGNRRYGLDLTPGLSELERPASSFAASCSRVGPSANGATPTFLRRVRRASVAALRQEAEAVDPAELARFLPAWQNVDAHRPAGAGPDRLREALVPLQGLALTPEGLGARRAPAPARRLQPGVARPAATSGEGSSGSAPARWRAPAGWRSTSARTSTWRAAAGEREARSPEGESTTRFASGSPSGVLLARPGHRARGPENESLPRRSGTWSGLARRPTTPCAAAGAAG